MSDQTLHDILAAVNGLNSKFDGLSSGVDSLSDRVDGLTEHVAKLRDLPLRVDGLADQLIKVRTEISARIGHLADNVGFVRDDAITAFHVADRARRMRTIEDKKAA